MFFETFSLWLPISPHTNVASQFKAGSVVDFQFKIA